VDRLRRLILISGAMSAAGLLTGCLTNALFKNEEYSEDISSVLISQDGKKLVVIGKQHHYIFEAPRVIVQTLRSSFHSSVAGAFGKFFVDSDGQTIGRYRLVLSKSTVDQDRADALAAGYESADDGQLSFNGELRGVRYSAGDVRLPATAEKLNNSYRVLISAEQSTAKKAAKSLLTPITVAVDGALFIVAIPLLAISLSLVDF
jgi:hypothetical protein